MERRFESYRERHVRFITADSHFDHINLLNFKDSNNIRFRGKDFTNIEDMNRVLIERWNNKIGPKDVVYHLGDFAMSRSYNRIKHLRDKLNGVIYLIPGNHDRLEIKEYLEIFDSVEACVAIDYDRYLFLLSHIPIHPMSLFDKNFWNIHGHIHEKLVDHPRYINVSVEQTNYEPLSLPEILELIKRRDQSGTTS